MTSTLRLALALMAIAPCLAAAQAAPAASAAAAAKPATPLQAHIVVIEDEAVRIEESHGRSGVRKVVVHSKLAGARDYEIQLAPPGRDPSQERGNAGRRSWSLFSF